MTDASHHAPPTGQGYEGNDVQLAPVLLFGLALVLITGMVFVLMSWLFNALNARQAAHDVSPSPLAQTRPAQPPAPRLQVAPLQELEQLRAAEDAALHSYGWLDQAAGVVRIPIDRAMDLLIERGLPVRPDSPAATPSQGGSPR
jgi:hypothetical protein